MRGRFTAESVDDLRRNRWTVYPGIGGRFTPESVVDLGRNTQGLRRAVLSVNTGEGVRPKAPMKIGGE